MIKIAELKEYVSDFVNTEDVVRYYSSGRVKDGDVIYTRLGGFTLVQKSRFDRVLEKARERVVVYVDRDEDRWEGYFNHLGYFWDYLGDLVYVVDKNE